MGKLIIFDCDGTLVDSEIVAAKVFPAVWATMGVQMTSEYFICNFVGTGSDAEIVKSTKALLPPHGMEIAHQKFTDELAQSLKPTQGMRELLESLPCQVCVASNSSLEYVNSVLEKTQLASFFSARVYSSRDLPRPKPAPDVFLHAARELGFTPDQCIVVEDSVSGVKAAQNAGMPVIGYMGGLHFNQVVKNKLLSAQADIYCASATELKETLFRWQSSAD